MRAAKLDPARCLSGLPSAPPSCDPARCLHQSADHASQPGLLHGRDRALRLPDDRHQRILGQDATLDVTWETWQAITDMRAVVAGEINEAADADLSAAQAAIQRVFECVILHVHDGKTSLHPAVRQDMLVDPTGYELVQPKRVALQMPEVGIKAPPRRRASRARARSPRP
jgi:hypothetical protein